MFLKQKNKKNRTMKPATYLQHIIPNNTSRQSEYPSDNNTSIVLQQQVVSIQVSGDLLWFPFVAVVVYHPHLSYINKERTDRQWSWSGTSVVWWNINLWWWTVIWLALDRNETGGHFVAHDHSRCVTTAEPVFAWNSASNWESRHLNLKYSAGKNK